MAREREHKIETEAEESTPSAMPATATEPEPAPAPPAAETFEEQQARLLREDFARRNAEAIAERKRILIENGQPDDTDTIDQINAQKRCCL